MSHAEGKDQFLDSLLGLLGFLVIVKLFGISFGDFTPAMLKLTAIILTTFAISVAIPGIGGLLAIAAYVILFMMLFDLEFREVVICVITLGIIRFLVSLLIGGLLLAAVHSLDLPDSTEPTSGRDSRSGDEIATIKARRGLHAGDSMESAFA